MKIVFLFLSLLIGGCAFLEPKAKIEKSFEEEFGIYKGPKASIAIVSFEWKAGKKEEGVGEGLEDMLTTVLIQSNRFKVLERKELKKIKEEIDLAETSYIDKTEKIEKGKIRSPEILVVAAITGWEPGASKIGGGLGGGSSNFLSVILGSFKKSYLAMDIRIIASETSEVLAATKVSGEAKEVDLGALAGGMFGSVPLGGALSKYSKTPMEKAIRICLKEAVKYIIEKTPKEYFKY